MRIKCADQNTGSTSIKYQCMKEHSVLMSYLRQYWPLCVESDVILHNSSAYVHRNTELTINTTTVLRVIREKTTNPSILHVLTKSRPPSI